MDSFLNHMLNVYAKINKVSTLVAASNLSALKKSILVSYFFGIVCIKFRHSTISSLMWRMVYFVNNHIAVWIDKITNFTYFEFGFYWTINEEIDWMQHIYFNSYDWCVSYSAIFDSSQVYYYSKWSIASIIRYLIGMEREVNYWWKKWVIIFIIKRRRRSSSRQNNNIFTVMNWWLMLYEKKNMIKSLHKHELVIIIIF